MVIESVVPVLRIVVCLTYPSAGRSSWILRTAMVSSIPWTPFCVYLVKIAPRIDTTPRIIEALNSALTAALVVGNLRQGVYPDLPSQVESQLVEDRNR